MAINCEEKLTAAIQKDCDNKPKGGIEVGVIFYNFDDLDKGNTTFDGSNDLIITNLATKSGTTGYLLDGIKQVNSASSELIKNEEGFDKHRHLFRGVILAPSAANKKRLDEIASGGRYVVIIEKKWKGTDQDDAFEILGYDAGLVIASVIWDTKESDGVIKFEIASEENFEEPKMPLNILETNYATTKTAFDGLFATA